MPESQELWKEKELNMVSHLAKAMREKSETPVAGDWIRIVPVAGKNTYHYTTTTFNINF